MRGPELTAAPGAVLGRLPSSGAMATRFGTWLVEGITGSAPPGTPSGTLLDRLLRVPWHAAIALLLFSYALQKAVDAEIARGYPAAWIALLAIPAGLFLLRRPLLLALVMALAGTYLRALYLSAPETCDQLAVSRAALAHVTGPGGTPYGFGYQESWPAGSPYPYGPLAMLTSLLGVPGEVIAVTGIMLILAFCRSLITLAILAAWVPAIEFGICGLNDQVPAFLLLAGLLLVERRDLIPGAALVAISAGIKPYTFAWFPGLMGLGGGLVMAVLAIVSGLLWLPVAIWGPGSYLHSVELARLTHPAPDNTLNVPVLRILALPITLFALLSRSWTTAVLSGAAIFLVVMFFDYWASLGYWFVVGPILGIVAERAIERFGAALREAREAAPAPAQPALA